MKLQKLDRDEKFLEEVLNDVLTIYEDVQGSKLFVRYDGENFEFRQKSFKNDPLSLIDVSLQKYFNKAINYFYNLDERVKKLLPKNFFFCFEYFPDETPANIEYSKTPKNNLILTGIVKNKKFDYSVEELIEFSNLLDCDPLPVIFYGKLNTKQKEGIKNFLRTDKKDLKYIFQEDNFALFFYKLLDPSHKHSFLMDEGRYQENLHRLILKTQNTNYKFEILNPLYEKISRNSSTEFTEIYSLIILNFMNFLQTIDLEKIKFSGNNYEELYISFICNLYNVYMNEMSEELKEFEFSIPEFFNKEKFKINIYLINNDLTKRYLLENDKYEYIFKCILGSFKHKKKKKVGVFTDNSLQIFNNFIDEVDKIISFRLNKLKEEDLRNKKLMNFGDYHNLKYDVDGQGDVYPDVYTEFEPKISSGKKGKKKKAT